VAMGRPRRRLRDSSEDCEHGHGQMLCSWVENPQIRIGVAPLWRDRHNALEGRGTRARITRSNAVEQQSMLLARLLYVPLNCIDIKGSSSVLTRGRIP